MSLEQLKSSHAESQSVFTVPVSNPIVSQDCTKSSGCTNDDPLNSNLAMDANSSTTASTPVAMRHSDIQSGRPNSAATTFFESSGSFTRAYSERNSDTSAAPTVNPSSMNSASNSGIRSRVDQLEENSRQVSSQVDALLEGIDKLKEEFSRPSSRLSSTSTRSGILRHGVPPVLTGAPRLSCPSNVTPSIPGSHSPTFSVSSLKAQDSNRFANTGLQVSTDDTLEPLTATSLYSQYTGRSNPEGHGFVRRTLSTYEEDVSKLPPIVQPLDNFAWRNESPTVTSKSSAFKPSSGKDSNTNGDIPGSIADSTQNVQVSPVLFPIKGPYGRGSQGQNEEFRSGQSIRPSTASTTFSSGKSKGNSLVPSAFLYANTKANAVDDFRGGISSMSTSRLSHESSKDHPDVEEESLEFADTLTGLRQESSLALKIAWGEKQSRIKSTVSGTEAGKTNPSERPIRPISQAGLGLGTELTKSERERNATNAESKSLEMPQYIVQEQSEEKSASDNREYTDLSKANSREEMPQISGEIEKRRPDLWKVQNEPSLESKEQFVPIRTLTTSSTNRQLNYETPQVKPITIEQSLLSTLTAPERELILKDPKAANILISPLTPSRTGLVRVANQLDSSRSDVKQETGGAAIQKSLFDPISKLMRDASTSVSLDSPYCTSAAELHLVLALKNLKPIKHFFSTPRVYIDISRLIAARAQCTQTQWDAASLLAHTCCDSIITASLQSAASHASYAAASVYKSALSTGSISAVSGRYAAALRGLGFDMAAATASYADINDGLGLVYAPATSAIGSELFDPVDGRLLSSATSSMLKAYFFFTSQHLTPSVSSSLDPPFIPSGELTDFVDTYAGGVDSLLTHPGLFPDLDSQHEEEKTADTLTILNGSAFEQANDFRMEEARVSGIRIPRGTQRRSIMSNDAGSPLRNNRNLPPRSALESLVNRAKNLVIKTNQSGSIAPDNADELWERVYSQTQLLEIPTDGHLFLPSIRVPAQHLCGCELDRPLLIRALSHRGSASPELIGQFRTTLRRLLNWPARHPSMPKDGSESLSPGTLYRPIARKDTLRQLYDAEAYERSGLLDAQDDSKWCQLHCILTPQSLSASSPSEPTSGGAIVQTQTSGFIQRFKSKLLVPIYPEPLELLLRRELVQSIISDDKLADSHEDQKDQVEEALTFTALLHSKTILPRSGLLLTARVSASLVFAGWKCKPYFEVYALAATPPQNSDNQVDSYSSKSIRRYILKSNFDDVRDAGGILSLPNEDVTPGGYGDDDWKTTIFAETDGRTWSLVYRSEVCTSSSSSVEPIWLAPSLNLESLCKNKTQRAIMVCVWHKGSGSDELIGKCVVSLRRLFPQPRAATSSTTKGHQSADIERAHHQVSFDIIDPSKKGEPRYKNSGVMTFEFARVFAPVLLRPIPLKTNSSD